MKIKIYLDSGADINCLGIVRSKCEFYQFPYDSPDRPKKRIKKGDLKLAKPSAAQWRDCNETWEESIYPWTEYCGSSHYNALSELIVYNSKKTKEALRRDVLHLDSAYKTGCCIFITSDRDIFSKRSEIEVLCNIKVFQSHKESKELVEYIQTIL